MFYRKRIEALEFRLTRLEDFVDSEIEADQARAVDRQVRWENECMKHECLPHMCGSWRGCTFAAAKPPRWFL